MDEEQGECGSCDRGDGEGFEGTSDEDKDKQGDSRLHRKQANRSNQVLKLDPWQIEALNHDGNLLLKTGRQVGKTTIMAIKSAKYMIEHPNSKIICCSLTEDQAQLIIVMVLDYLEKNYKTWIAKGTKKPTKNKIILTNKSEIIARPVGNTGDAVRGFTGDVLILDEASRFAEFIFTASKPTLLTTGGQIWMCSTPFGKQGYFYEAYQNKSQRFKVIEANSWDVIHERPLSDSWTLEKREKAIEFLEAEKRDCSKLQFAQEYMGLFVEDLKQFFSDELIQKACKLKRREYILPDRDYYLGVDIARLGEDEITYEILHKINDETIEHVESIVKTKQLTTQTHDDIVNLERNWDFRKIGIDAGSGSLGVGILDWLLREPLTKRKTIALNNLSRDMDSSGKKKKTLLKEDMYQNLRAMLERGTLKLLCDDEIMASLKSIQYEYSTEHGQLSKVRIFGNYSHIVEGLIRAAWLANTKSLNHRIYWI